MKIVESKDVLRINSFLLKNRLQPKDTDCLTHLKCSVNTNIPFPGSVSLFAAAFAVWSAKLFLNKILSSPF